MVRRVPTSQSSIAAVVLIATWGCGPAGGPGTGLDVQVTDSAGVRMVANPGTEIPLAVESALRIGVVEGDPDYQFSGIRTIAVDSIHGVWVLDENPSARYYDAEGRYRTRAGARGDGPGESQGYYSVWVHRGQVLLHGGRNGLQLFAPDGTLGESFPTRSGAGGMMANPLGPSGEAWNLYRSRFREDDQGVFRTQWVIGRGSLTEAGFDTLLVLPGPPMRMSAGGMSVGQASYFDGAPTMRPGPDGSVVYARSMAYRIESFDRDGSLTQVVTREAEPVPYDPSVEQLIEPAVRHALREITGGSSAEDQVARITAAATPETNPSHLPFTDGLFVASDGTIWVGRGDIHPRPASRSVAQAFGYAQTAWIDDWLAPAVFELFTADGRYRGTVRLPGAFLPLAVTEDRVYGLETDSFDVQYVVAYEVTGGD